MSAFEALWIRLLGRADIRLNGERPWDIQVHDDRLYRKALLQGSLGFGEAYMDGWFTVGDLEELTYRFLRADVAAWSQRSWFMNASAWLSNQQSRRLSTRVARQHYSFGNDLFFEFLGRWKNYSCGYFRGDEGLDQAQCQKMDLVCRKLGLQPGERLLDVGGGWGEFARYAATHHGVHVTSINISEEQMRYAREYCRGTSVEIVRSDYRDMTGTFDKIAAIAMFTHVGSRNYRTFMETMSRLLAPNGVFFMEGVWGNTSVRHVDRWIDTYIFPGGQIPSGAQTFEAFEGLFVAEDVHNFGPHYVKTLRAWNDNFQNGWPSLSSRYDERTRRMFEYFFLTIAASFRARVHQHWHLVLTKPGTTQPRCRLS